MKASSPYLTASTAALALTAFSPNTLGQAVNEIPEGLHQIAVESEIGQFIRRELPEGASANPDYLNPIYDPNLYLTEDAQVTLTFLDEGAGFRNSLGFFTYQADTFTGKNHSDFNTNGRQGVSFSELIQPGTGIQGDLLLPNTSRLNAGGQLEPGDSVTLGGGEVYSAGTHIGFFLIQNAWQNGTVKGYSDNSEPLTFYTVDMLNPENQPSYNQSTSSLEANTRHVAMLFNGSKQEDILMGFEDLYRPWGDNDFNDAVFRVTSNPVVAISGTNIPTAVAVVPEKPSNTFNVEVCESSRHAIRDYLPERINVNAEYLDTQYDPNLVISEATQIAVTFNDEGASYQNSLGYFTYQEDTFTGLTHGSINQDGLNGVSLRELNAIDGVETGLVFPKAAAINQGGPLEHGETALLGDGIEFPAGTRVGFFLIQDGWDTDHVKGYGADTADPLVFYTVDMLNPENDADSNLLTDSLEQHSRHVAMLFANESRESIVMGIEDLHRLDPTQNALGYGNDEDFNDQIFCVWAIQSQALSQSNLFAPTTIPEPGSVIVFALGSTLLLTRRRHKTHR